VPGAPTASIVIPTRSRPDYLDVTLGSVIPQARAAGAEVLVVSDGPDPQTEAVAANHGARLVSIGHSRGANAARNRGVRAAGGELVVFIDDDVAAPAGWLPAILTGVQSSPDRDVFGGPIHARLEGGGPRGCGREPPPITTLELGSADRDVPLVWSANMAVRRRAFDRIGLFDEAIFGRGEEEEWERRYALAGGQIRYLADAGLEHRRTAGDSRLRMLARSAYALGQTARRNDVRKREAQPISAELRVLGGCVWHTLRRRCSNGVVMSAQALGRVREAFLERFR
jgi:GT2 family glycosyltransferase